MGAPLAFLICSIGIAGLFFLNRDKSIRNSAALWLPTIWLGIVGSRPVSAWLGTGGGAGGSLNATLDGSPTDAAIFGILTALGVLVLFHRKKKTGTLLALSAPIIVFFIYCLISVTWSPFHGPAFKRWIKAVGDLVMVLIILTDGEPIAALRRIYSRLGFVLFPISIVLIRYTDLGRGFDPDGNPMNIGVTTNKNTLGLIVFVILLGTVWSLWSLLTHKDEPNRRRRLIAQATLFAFGLALLEMAHSATSVTCFALGGGLMFATSVRAIRRRPRRVGALCLVVVLGGALAVFFGGASVLSSELGRGEGLSGRSEIWAAAIASAGNPVIGTGFESFWNANGSNVARRLSNFWDIKDLVSAHNGYIEVYLDLGWIGVCLIALILVSGYRHATRAFQYDPEFGGLMVAYIATATFYSMTEAGFRMMTPSWIFLLLAVVGSNALASGAFQKTAIQEVELPLTNVRERLGSAMAASNTDYQKRPTISSVFGTSRNSPSRCIAIARSGSWTPTRK